MASLLIVDDDPDMRMVARMVAEDCGWDVITEASDAEEALDLLRAATPDVVLIDFHLPGMDGATATEQVKSVCPRAAVVSWSSSDDKAVGGRFQRAGAVAHIAKGDLAGLRVALARYFAIA